MKVTSNMKYIDSGVALSNCGAAKLQKRPTICCFKNIKHNQKYFIFTTIMSNSSSQNEPYFDFFSNNRVNP